MKKLLFVLLLCAVLPVCAQKNYTLQSPDGSLKIEIATGDQLTYALTKDGQSILTPSPLALRLADGRVLGEATRVRKAQNRSVDAQIESPLYKRAQIRDHFNELTLRFRGDYAVVFRAYDEGVAYRFVTELPAEFEVADEVAKFCFAENYKAYVPYVNREGSFEKQYYNSFENVYTYVPLDELKPTQLAFTPVVVETGAYKVCLVESDLESYPGMYLYNPERNHTLQGNFAPYPKRIEQGGHNRLQGEVKERENYIARCEGKRSFPWRGVIVASEDRQLADNDLVYKLAAPARIDDWSWVKPGKVAWEWWNNWGLKGVDFRTGVNDATYKAYIDFAAEAGIEYVILDEGWAVNLEADLFQVVPEIDLEELVSYARQKGVDLILWAGYYAFNRDLERVCEHYSKMGIKGFKVDFMDRDDQAMVDFHYRAAQTAAKYHLMLDFHGTYKPTGINRTYPNVVNFEGVHGLEQLKWSKTADQVTYDVTMPFVRMVAGPVDYTQGAMHNATRKAFLPVYGEPMSQGTRAHQLGAYLVFESPLSMLCDSPSNYQREPECTAFIASVPTVWDESRAIDGKIGKYVVTARRSGEVWYVGGLTDWKARTMKLDLSFVGEGDFEVEIFCDGMNADRIASDYYRGTTALPQDRQMEVAMAPGGGFAMKITRR